MRAFGLGALLLWAGCGSTSPPPSADGSSCLAVIEAHLFEGQLHVPTCSPVTYASNPPTTGNHYPIWAAFGIYDRPVPRGFWVHDLEHGAVVITYNCTDCSEEIVAIKAFIESLPVDPSCAGATGSTGPKRRLLLTPDPELDVRFAASAWEAPAYEDGGLGSGFTLRAPCFDVNAFRSFVAAHYARGPEDFCFDGMDPFGPDGAAPICGP